MPVELEAPPVWPEPAARTVAVGPHRVHVRSLLDAAPPGRMPVVLVHGQIVSGRYLEPTLQRLAPHFPVIAPDLPGYGQSSDPEAFLGTEALADVLAGVLEALMLERVALFGNSFGCGIATAVAVRHPERVDRLVLQGPTLAPALRSSARSLWRGLRSMRHEAPRFWRIMLHDTRRAGLRRAWRTWQLAIHDPIEARLARIHQSTLVVVGTEDPIVPRAWAERVVAMLPNGRLVVVPKAAHLVALHQSAALVETVRPFLLAGRGGNGGR